MWRQNIPDWLPLATLLTGKELVSVPVLTRLAELLIVGIISGVATVKGLETEVSMLKTAFATHERKQEADKEREDRKWDDRINRLENCFIMRSSCGLITR